MWVLARRCCEVYYCNRLFGLAKELVILQYDPYHTSTQRPGRRSMNLSASNQSGNTIGGIESAFLTRVFTPLLM